MVDLILLDGNPLLDIHALDTIHGVMLNGRWLSKEDIARILKGLEKS